MVRAGKFKISIHCIITNKGVKFHANDVILLKNFYNFASI